eukprot:GHVS01058757.1.p1 GENE.GHVS01058757.1~~GHVS01058757.1.p1  ORF type:complete len:113 (-),score=8.07 GHVS01058757.1:74-385(-)
MISTTAVFWPSCSDVCCGPSSALRRKSSFFLLYSLRATALCYRFSTICRQKSICRLKTSRQAQGALPPVIEIIIVGDLLLYVVSHMVSVGDLLLCRRYLHNIF